MVIEGVNIKQQISISPHFTRKHGSSPELTTYPHNLTLLTRTHHTSPREVALQLVITSHYFHKYCHTWAHSSFSLQDGAAKWLYFLTEPPGHPADHMDVRLARKLELDGCHVLSMLCSVPTRCLLNRQSMCGFPPNQDMFFPTPNVDVRLDRKLEFYGYLDLSMLFGIPTQLFTPSTKYVRCPHHP